MLGTERLDALNLGGNGHKPPPPDKSPPGQKTPWTKAPRTKIPTGPGHPTSGDIFYCSGSRQLNHSSVVVVLVVIFDDKRCCVFCALGLTQTDEEVWEKLSSFVDEEMNDDINNNEDCSTTHYTSHQERHSAGNHSATKTALLGKRHGADDQWPDIVALNKRHCVDADERHSADNHLTVSTALLGERHSADLRGINVLGAVPSNTSLRTVFRSISSGIIANLRSMSPPSQQLVGLSRIIGSGGALARNSAMCKAVKDMYDLPLVINSKSDTGDSAVGAALAAARFL